MAESRYFQIRRVSIDSSSWTPITTPMDCSKVTLDCELNANNWKVRTDADNSASERTQTPGQVYTVEGVQHPGVVPFPAGVVVCYIQSAAGTGPIVAQFFR